MTTVEILYDHPQKPRIDINLSDFLILKMLSATVPLELQSRYRKVFKFLQSKGLQLRYANVGGRFTHFFRNDQLVKIVSQHETELRAQLNSQDSPLNEIRKALIFLERSVNGSRPLKYPTSLTYSEEESEFATLPFDISESLTALIGGTLIAVIFIVLLPVMPLTVRYWVWRMCYYALKVIGVVVAVRAGVRAFGEALGLRIALLPNLLRDLNWRHRLTPLVTTGRNKTMEEVLVRVINLWVLIRISRQMLGWTAKIMGRELLPKDSGPMDLLFYLF